MNQIQDDFLSPYEAEHLVENLVDIDLKEYGSKTWFKQHETLDRLNIQAHKNALGSTDEFVMEAFVTHDKITPLVNDLLTAEAWKSNVLPIISSEVAKLSSIKSYLCLYHEASVCNLLEVMLYHRTACEGSEDALVELIDYCYRKFINLTAKGEEYTKKREETPVEKKPKDILAMSQEDELKKHADEIEFTCAMTGLSLIRFVTDHMQGLSVPVVHQLMENNDLPCVLVPILEMKPWLRKNSKGEMEKWEDQKWTVVPPAESSRVTKVEAQIWLAIYNMFLSQDSNRKYEVTSFRKQNLLRLRKYLNEQLLDQLPMLAGMLRALEEMAMMTDNPIAQKNSFIVQQLPELRAKIMANRDWRAIAAYQLENFFSTEVNDPKEELDSLMKLYGSNVYEQFMEDPKCACCGIAATHRCSKCKSVWYCSRECQLSDWKVHKEMCKMLTEVKKEEASRDAEIKAMNKDKADAAQKKKRPLIQEMD